MEACYICHKPLPEDPHDWCMVIIGELVEAEGLSDVSEIGDEHRVFAKICLACGFREGCRTAYELQQEARKMEEEEESGMRVN